MLWSTVKMQERHDQRIENIVSGLERIKQEHAGQRVMVMLTTDETGGGYRAV